MAHYLTIRMNDKLFVRDPEVSSLGRNILQHSIILIHEIGFEAFTFRKLAQATGTTEASVYRYFTNKHRLLLYLFDWYWSWQEYRLVFHTQNVHDSRQKIRTAIGLLASRVLDDAGTPHINESLLHHIIVHEGAKSWLTKHVEEDNRDHLFKPYKDMCARIAEYILEYRPGYAYPNSLASTIMEISHGQDFFSRHLPSLTDFKASEQDLELVRFLEEMVFGALDRT